MNVSESFSASLVGFMYRIKGREVVVVVLCLSVRPSVHPLVCPSVCLSVCLSVYLRDCVCRGEVSAWGSGTGAASVCLSVYLFVCVSA